MRKPCPCCGGVPGGFGGTLVVNSQPADLQAENARLRELLSTDRELLAHWLNWYHGGGGPAKWLITLTKAAHSDLVEQAKRSKT